MAILGDTKGKEEERNERFAWEGKQEDDTNEGEEREKDVEEVGGRGRDDKIGMMREAKITTERKREQGQQE